MLQVILFALMHSGSAQALPKFHCYTMPNTDVISFHRPVRCADGEKMEVVCTYSAGCLPRPGAAPIEPPKKSDYDLAVMFQSGALKPSYLLCVADKVEISKEGQVTSAQCPPPTKCLEDGLFMGVPVSKQVTTVPLSAPVKDGEGKANVTR